MQTFVIANGSQTKFRTWDEFGPAWTENILEATWLSRRIDAERMCLTDEDATFILPIDPVAEALRAAHVSIPGGNVCDPQKIADGVRELAKSAGVTFKDG